MRFAKKGGRLKTGNRGVGLVVLTQTYFSLFFSHPNAIENCVFVFWWVLWCNRKLTTWFTRSSAHKWEQLNVIEWCTMVYWHFSTKTTAWNWTVCTCSTSMHTHTHTYGLFIYLRRGISVIYAYAFMACIHRYDWVVLPKAHAMNLEFPGPDHLRSHKGPWYDEEIHPRFLQESQWISWNCGKTSRSCKILDKI